jgi:hypothetical protein
MSVATPYVEAAGLHSRKELTDRVVVLEEKLEDVSASPGEEKRIEAYVFDCTLLNVAGRQIRGESKVGASASICGGAFPELLLQQLVVGDLDQHSTQHSGPPVVATLCRTWLVQRFLCSVIRSGCQLPA